MKASRKAALPRTAASQKGADASDQRCTSGSRTRLQSLQNIDNNPIIIYPSVFLGRSPPKVIMTWWGQAI
eukprot:4923871-Pyramimonas_sp.AAC.1